MGVIQLGSMKFPVSMLPVRVLVFGKSGSGKSAMLKVLRRSLVTLGDVAIFDTDNANELVNWYRHFGVKESDIHPINMTYMDGIGIDFASMITSEMKCQLVAKQLIVESKNESNRFFPDMARNVMSNSCMSLHRLAPGKALMADMIRVTMWPKLHTALAELAGLRDPYLSFGDNDSRRDTQVTLESRLAPLAAFSAVDMKRERRGKFPASHGVTVFEWTYETAPAIGAVITFLQEYLAVEKLSVQSKEQAFVIMDEFRLLEKTEMLVPLAAQGRKSGLSFVITAHTVNGVFEKFGKDLGQEILSLPEFKFFMKLSCHDTAEWASKALGEVEVREDLQNLDNRWSASIKNRRNVLPSELMYGLREPSWKHNKLEGWASLPREVSKFECGFRDACEVPEMAERERVPDGWQTLERFSVLDLARLGIKITQELYDILHKDE